MITDAPDARSNQLHFIHSWVLPILLKGRKKILGLEDLYQPLPDHYADTLGTKLEKAWLEQLNKQRAKNKKPSLMAAGLKVFGFDIIFLGTLLLIFEMLFKATMPIFLGGIVKYYANPERSNISEAYLYSAGLIACSFFSVLSQHSLMLSNLTCGMRIRIAACSMIYRKSLKLSKTAMVNTTSGQIVNLLSNDVGR
jgi:ATP-binding cassette, subfamily C (CFTR/MRP), member 4